MEGAGRGPGWGMRAEALAGSLGSRMHFAPGGGAEVIWWGKSTGSGKKGGGMAYAGMGSGTPENEDRGGMTGAITSGSGPPARKTFGAVA